MKNDNIPYTGVTIICAGCNKKPKEIDYSLFKDPDEAHAKYVWDNEGTLDKKTGKFLCDPCYIRYGQPSSDEGWTATPENLAEIGLGSTPLF